MAASHLTLEEQQEVERLIALLPIDLAKTVAIHPAGDREAEVIKTLRSEAETFTIAINFYSWQRLNSDQRNLLFWHQVSRIQGGAVPRSQWERIGILIGLSFGLMELISQNPLSLAIGLAITGFSAYQLYQRQWGEHSLKVATAADQGAIQLALQAGYSWERAYGSLESAVKFLAQLPEKPNRKQCQVRLSVLEITAAKRHALSQRKKVLSPSQSPQLLTPLGAKRVTSKLF